MGNIMEVQPNHDTQKSFEYMDEFDKFRLLTL